VSPGPNSWAPGVLQACGISRKGCYSATVLVREIRDHPCFQSQLHMLSVGHNRSGSKRSAGQGPLPFTAGTEGLPHHSRRLAGH